MAMNIEKIEEGVQTLENHPNKSPSANYPEDTNKSLMATWGLLVLSCACSVLGATGGPLLLRLYFLRGGHSKWLASWLETVGFPVLIIPLTILYFQRDRTLPAVEFFASQKLLLYAAIIGLLQGLDNFMYCFGLSFLPVSTSSLLLSTMLISTAFCSSIMVKQKFTPYTINSVVLMTLGSILLGLRKSGDRPHGVSNAQYLLGFVITIGAAALGGFILVCTQVAYAKANKAMTYPIVLQFQFCMSFATLFCTLGILITKDLSAIRREPSGFHYGAKNYYMVLASSVVIWQVMFLGRLGIIFYTSSLFAGIMSATILPITQIAAVITFHEKFTGEKGMALALGLWGFTSYFYGNYRKTKKQAQQRPHETNTTK